MNYREIRPPAYLKDYIRSFWIFTSTDSVAAHYSSFRLTADGCPGLIFQHQDFGVFQKEEKMLPPLFLYGQATACYQVKLTGKFRTIGVYFYPNALKAVFGLDAHVLTNACIDMAQLSVNRESKLTEQLLNAENLDQQIEWICAYLFAKIKENNAKTDPAIRYALNQFISSNGSIPLKLILEKLPLSLRDFERKFRQQVGLAPKLFARICQFQGSLSSLENGAYLKLSDIAFENGYADQSHFIRSFKTFAGISPRQYKQLATNIFQNLSGMVL